MARSLGSKNFLCRGIRFVPHAKAVRSNTKVKPNRRVIGVNFKISLKALNRWSVVFFFEEARLPSVAIVTRRLGSQKSSQQFGLFLEFLWRRVVKNHVDSREHNLGRGQFFFPLSAVN